MRYLSEVVDREREIDREREYEPFLSLISGRDAQPRYPHVTVTRFIIYNSTRLSCLSSEHLGFMPCYFLNPNPVKKRKLIY